MTFPSVHGGTGHAFTHAGASSNDDLRQANDAPRPAQAGHRSGVQLPRPRAYDWQDDAFKSYRLACDLIGERIFRRRIIAALKHRAAPTIEIAEAIE